MKQLSLVIVLALIVAAAFILRPSPAGPSSAQVVVPRGSPRLAELLGSEEKGAYAAVLETRHFSFPEDHGPHPEYRNEWWYITGNLDGDAGERFGFEITLFRIAVTPRAEADANSWRSNQVFMGHFAITDVAADEFYAVQRFSRGSKGLAGAQAEPFRIWLDDWELAATPSEQANAGEPDGPAATRWRLRANDAEISLDLDLTALKSPVLNGEGGFSQKSAEPGNASYYYSISRLHTTGKLRVRKVSYNVSGLSWLDREWGSGALALDQQGWDWFALQLSDGSELMYYELRRADGAADRNSAGTFVSDTGTAMALSHDDVRVEVLDYWTSPDGVRYPMAWQLRVEPLDLTVRIKPVMRNQELSGLVRYWEGAVDFEGEFDDANKVNGRGYVELTGYADSQNATATKNK